MLQIDHLDSGEMILACTLMKDKPEMFEIDLECDLLLSQMASEDLFIKSTSYQSALSFCRIEAENWKRQIRPFTLDFGMKRNKRGTVSGAYMLSTRNKTRAMRLRSSPPPPSKLSLLFRPSSASHLNNNKDALKRAQSFNMEVQSVSLSLTQDDEEETNKLSTLFNYVIRRKSNNKNRQARASVVVGNSQEHESTKGSSLLHQQQLIQRNCNYNLDGSKAYLNPLTRDASSYPDVLYNQNNSLNSLLERRRAGTEMKPRPGSSLSLFNGSCSGDTASINANHINKMSVRSESAKDVPYGTVLDDLNEEENVYSEISDTFTQKLNLSPIHRMGIQFHRQLDRHRSASNMSSLLNGSGGSDGTFSGTLSGTFSSSNPSSREEDIYDAVF